jgi:hypothetical protein
VVLVALLLGGCSLSKGSHSPDPDGLRQQVRHSMQDQLSSDPKFSKYRLYVVDVTLIRSTGNEYEGMADVRTGTGVQHQVPVHVTADSEHFIWRTDPGAFLWTAFDGTNTSE